MLNINNISFSINDKNILKNVSFQCKTNKILAILGPNGAGKSTLMNIISGITYPQTGRVSINGENLHKLNLTKLSQLRSVVTQKSHLQTPFTVLDVILMGRTPHTLASNEENIKIALQAINDTDLTNYIDRNYLQLSGGEQQRVQIARALAQIAYEKVNDNRYLMLDEHTSNLDIGKAYNLMNICKSFVNSNFGVIWIVHDINLALDFADEFLFLKRGSILALGNKEVVTEKLISELYDIKIEKKILENDRIFFAPAIN